MLHTLITWQFYKNTQKGETCIGISRDIDCPMKCVTSFLLTVVNTWIEINDCDYYDNFH